MTMTSPVSSVRDVILRKERFRAEARARKHVRGWGALKMTLKMIINEVG